MSFASEYAARAATTEQRLAYPTVLQLLGDVQGKRGLDYGCGNGHFSRTLRDRGAHMLALDSDPQQIVGAAGYDNRGIKTRLIKPYDLSSVKPESIDFVVANFVLCTTPTPDLLFNTVTEFHRVLTPEGVAVICEPNPETYDIQFKSFRREAPCNKYPGAEVLVHLNGVSKPIIDYYWETEDYYKETQAAGFQLATVWWPTTKGQPDETNWPAESQHPPFLIIKAKK
jgi:toxoflavin synthase